MMTVNELKKQLERYPEDAIVLASVWNGESNFYKLREPLGNNRIYRNTKVPGVKSEIKFVLISWNDDCSNDKVYSDEIELVKQ